MPSLSAHSLWLLSLNLLSVYSFSPSAHSWLLPQSTATALTLTVVVVTAYTLTGTIFTAKMYLRCTNCNTVWQQLQGYR